MLGQKHDHREIEEFVDGVFSKIREVLYFWGSCWIIVEIGYYGVEIDLKLFLNDKDDSSD